MREDRPNFNLNNIHPTPSLDKTRTTAPCTTTTNTVPNKQDTTSTTSSSNESKNANKIICNISKDTDVLCLALLPSPPLVQQPSPPLTGRSSNTTVKAESNKSNYNNNSNNMYINSSNDASGNNSDRDQVVDNSDNNRKVIAVASMRSVFFNQGNT